MKTLTKKILLGLRNRDGEIMIGEDADGVCYLIAEAATYGNAEVFSGLDSTEQIEISKDAFYALSLSAPREVDEHG